MWCPKLLFSTLLFVLFLFHFIIINFVAFNTDYHDGKEMDFDLNSKSMRRGGYGYYTKSQLRQRSSTVRPSPSGILQ